MQLPREQNLLGLSDDLQVCRQLRQLSGALIQALRYTGGWIILLHSSHTPPRACRAVQRRIYPLQAGTRAGGRARARRPDLTVQTALWLHLSGAGSARLKGCTLAEARLAPTTPGSPDCTLVHGACTIDGLRNASARTGLSAYALHGAGSPGRDELRGPLQFPGEGPFRRFRVSYPDRGCRWVARARPDDRCGPENPRPAVLHLPRRYERASDPRCTDPRGGPRRGDPAPGR